MYSYTAFAAAELSVLSRQLNNETTHETALRQIKVKAQQDQSALEPLFRFYCGDYVKHVGGKAYMPVRNISKFLETYLSTHALEQPALDAMVDAVWECGRQRSEFAYQLDSLLDKLSESQRFSGRQLDKIVRLTDLYLQYLLADQTSKKNNVTYYLRVLANQTKFQRLPDKARVLAVQSLELQVRYNAFYPAMGILSGQLKYNDKQSERILLDIAKSGNETKRRKSALSRLATWHKKAGRPDEFVPWLLELTEKETDPQMKQACQNNLAAFVGNEKLSTFLVKKIILAVQEKDTKQLLSNLLQGYRKKALSTALTKDEIEFVTEILFGPYAQSTLGFAANVLAIVSNKQGLDRKLHEDLLRLYVQRRELWGNVGFNQLTLKNIPYRNVNNAGEDARYPEVLLQDIVTTLSGDNANVDRVLGILKTIYEYQGLSRQNIDFLYTVFAGEKNIPRKKRILDFLIQYNNDTGYTKVDVLYADLAKWNDYYSKRVYDLVAAGMRQRLGDVDALLAIFSDRSLHQQARFYALHEILKLDFDLAVTRLLPPPSGETEQIQEMIWTSFENASAYQRKRVDKTLLLKTTKHKNKSIRHSAWRMLSLHDVDTPFLVKWERKNFRNQVLFGALFFGGSPITLLLGTLIFLVPKKRRKAKYSWLEVLKIILWFIATLLAIAAGGIAVIGAGMSHSGTPYGFLYTTFITIFSCYLLLAVMVRWLIPTIPFDQDVALPLAEAVGRDTEHQG